MLLSLENYGALPLARARVKRRPCLRRLERSPRSSALLSSRSLQNAWERRGRPSSRRVGQAEALEQISDVAEEKQGKPGAGQPPGLQIIIVQHAAPAPAEPVEVFQAA